MSAYAAPVTLEGARLRLEPLAAAHADALEALATDPELWRFTPTRIEDRAGLDAYIEAALAEQRAGGALPFALVERAGGRAVGSTRLGHMDPEHERVEIGWTWVGRPFQRRGHGTESKLLLLSHAFETLGCRRVEFRVDALNVPSRRAVARLGAREEGTLRQHTRLPDGRFVDWVYSSILRKEWPAVRAALRQRVAGRGPSGPAAEAPAGGAS